MSAQNGSADSTKRDSINTSETPTFDKGKGKATADPTSHDMSMGEEEDSSSEEEIDEASVRKYFETQEHQLTRIIQTAEVGTSNSLPFSIASGSHTYYDTVDDVDEDNMEEIDTSNIVGRRTRGRQIDFAKAAQDLPEDDEDEEDDDDFEEPVADEDKMEEQVERYRACCQSFVADSAIQWLENPIIASYVELGLSPGYHFSLILKPIASIVVFMLATKVYIE